ncbi:MAG TPA: hypothetical protein VFW23_16075 [Tepidisphaeraceae bacterium]|nr:hypothetical protein [Tepidisphaeraceae bacterium]
MAETENQKAPEGSAGNSPKFVFNYIKSNYFRVIHGAGALGSVSFDGLSVRMAIYTERVPIPLMQVWEGDEKGELIKLVNTTGREGIVREVETEIVMSVDVARGLSKWLSDQVRVAEEYNSARQASPPEQK